MIIKEKFISACIGTLFFVVFQPFGISTFGMPERLLIPFGVLVVAFASCLTSESIVNYVLRMPMVADRGPSYTMKRGLVFQLCNIIVLTIFLSLYFDRFVSNEQIDNHLSTGNLLKVLGASVGCSFFVGLYWRNVYWKRHYAQQLEEAQLLNGVLMERARIAPFLTSSEVQEDDTTSKNSTHCPSQLITLEGSTKESVTLLPSDFLFAESEGNYVSIHYIDGGEANQAMLRTSMKNVIAILCENKDIIQCHRAYIVNLRYVASVEGRSSGIGLKLRHCEAVIPVSKSYVSSVKEHIKNPV